MKNFLQHWMHNFKRYFKLNFILLLAIALFRFLLGDATDVLAEIFEIGDLFSVSLAIFLGVLINNFMITAIISVAFALIDGLVGEKHENK